MLHTIYIFQIHLNTIWIIAYNKHALLQAFTAKYRVAYLRRPCLALLLSVLELFLLSGTLNLVLAKVSSTRIGPPLWEVEMKGSTKKDSWSCLAQISVKCNVFLLILRNFWKKVLRISLEMDFFSAKVNFYIRHFVNSTFCAFDILWIRHFVHSTFCEFDILFLDILWFDILWFDILCIRRFVIRHFVATPLQGSNRLNVNIQRWSFWV